MTEQKFKEIFCLMMDFKGKKISSPTQADSWYSLLKDYPDKQLVMAFMVYCRSTDEFPNPGKIIDIMENPKDLDLIAEEAWVSFCDTVDKALKGEVKIQGEIFLSFIKGYGGLGEFKYIYEKRSNAIYLKQAFTRFFSLKYKETKKQQMLIKAHKTLGLLTNGNKRIK